MLGLDLRVSASLAKHVLARAKLVSGTCVEAYVTAAQCKLLRGLGLECAAYPELRKLHLFGCRQLETEGVRQDNCRSCWCILLLLLPTGVGSSHLMGLCERWWCGHWMGRSLHVTRTTHSPDSQPWKLTMQRRLCMLCCGQALWDAGGAVASYRA